MAMEMAGIIASKLLGSVELLYSTGTPPIQPVYAHIVAGLFEVVMFVGADKLYVPDKSEAFYKMQCACDRDFDCIH
jgi:hypothetical protein